MKKIFTLVVVALSAISANAQTEVLDVASENIQTKIASAIANPTQNSNSKFIMVPESEKIFPVGTWETGDFSVITGGTSISLTEYVWEASTASITLKAVSTPNADAAANESWQVVSTNNNMKLNVEGCSPAFTMAMKGKNGNPSLAYYDFYEYNQDNASVHRVGETLWSIDCNELPAKGQYYEFTASTSGLLKVGVYIHRINGVKTVILDKETKRPLPKTGMKLEGFMQNNTWNGFEEKVWHDFVINDVYEIEANGNNRAVFGYLSFEVEAGKSYMLFCHKQQLGLYGYEFTPGATLGINSIANSVEKSVKGYYTLDGAKVNAPVNGITIVKYSDGTAKKVIK